MSDKKVTINNKEYQLNPLRCGQLRQITKILEERKNKPSATGFSDIEVWMPFIAASIKIGDPDFDQVELDNLTLQEFSDTWESIVAMSGVKLIRGEVSPVQRAASTGETSTEDSAPAQVPPIVN